MEDWKQAAMRLQVLLENALQELAVRELLFRSARDALVIVRDQDGDVIERWSSRQAAAALQAIDAIEGDARGRA
jgi:hypothetical protein